MSRPARVALEDFDGKKTTLPDNPESWLIIRPEASPEDPLVLGLGPLGAPPWLAGINFAWIEEPSTLSRLRERPGFAMPANDREVAPAEVASLAANRTVYFYKHGLKLAPDFWGQLLAVAEKGQARPEIDRSLAWLPGDERSLLHRELVDGLRGAGFERIETRKFAAPEEFARFFGERAPSLALSVNFRGLDPEGRIFYLLRELGVPLAVWLVDNPWHLLSSLSLPWWRQVPLFVTDRGFIGPLKAYGAAKVLHCPLAYAGHMRREEISWKPDAAPVFVGRSAFPGRDAFFGRSPLPVALMREAEALFASGRAPDYRWFARRLNPRLWPGLAARQPGKGADYFSARNRAAWISAMESPVIIGDEGWRHFFPGADLRPPVDYYGSLPEIYASAAYALNVTSLLLPGGLNQRHFDVWAAGGLPLTDMAGGLDLFPRELTDPVSMERPAELAEKWSALRDHPSGTRELIAAWREVIFRDHSYEKRCRFILNSL
ncbi:MAG: glycosyltransferase [Desulfovibrio sp.]|nr:glycosyltransferase [Desulfovibrio sp.]